MRLQTMILPSAGDEVKFVLVLDQTGEVVDSASADIFKTLAKDCGAVTGAVFSGAVEVL
jgi:hypothetical protein